MDQSGVPVPIGFSGGYDPVGLGGGYSNRPNITNPGVKMTYPKKVSQWFDTTRIIENSVADDLITPSWLGGNNLGFGDIGKDAMVGPMSRELHDFAVQVVCHHRAGALTLMYLGDKIGKFLPPASDVRARKTVMEWLFWQMGGLGPMSGQNTHFFRCASEKLPYAISRYNKEVNRLYGVMDGRLNGRAFLAGDDYSIADMASYPWVKPWEMQGQNMADFPNLKRWLDSIAERPATVRAYAKGQEISSGPPAPLTDEGRRVLFGQTAETIRKAGGA